VLAQAQVVAAFGHQFALVAHGAQGLVAAGLEAGLHIVGGHLRAQCAHVGHQLAQFGNQHVGRKVAVHLFQAR
jgi:hypothetical protein